MATLSKFTHARQNAPVYVNPDLVTSVRANGSETLIRFGAEGNSVLVKEPLDQVVERLNQAWDR